MSGPSRMCPGPSKSAASSTGRRRSTPSNKRSPHGSTRASIQFPMKLLTWNIQHGGGTRLARIVEEVAAYDADVIALTEFRDRPGTALRAAMLERGWPYIETTNPTGNVNGIAAFSRTPMRRTRPCLAPPEGFDRWLDIDLPEYGFDV